MVQEPARKMAQAEAGGTREASEAARGAVVWSRDFTAAFALPTLPARPCAARAAHAQDVHR